MPGLMGHRGVNDWPTKESGLREERAENGNLIPLIQGNINMILQIMKSFINVCFYF